MRAANNRHWLRCEGTWFVGVNALPNNTCGEVGDSGPLRGAAVDFIRRALGFEMPASAVAEEARALTAQPLAWDRGQLSVCYPGYPRAMSGESAKAARFRRERDAAHVDGLLPEGAERRRHLREHHAFIFGIPLTSCRHGAAPFVVWEGSHKLMQDALHKRLGHLPAAHWGEEDITAAYQRARLEIFTRCPRVEVYVQPGEAFVVHRLALHGMAPWDERAEAGPDGRAHCYFRPQLRSPRAWLERA